MTHLELRDLLYNRVGWKAEIGFSPTLLSSTTTSESGRYFQDEHNFVNLKNIYATMENEKASKTALSSFLDDLKSRAIILVLADVFEVDDIQDDVLDCYSSVFDNAISKRMAIIIGEQILTSTRSNRAERITKEIQQQLFFELNGNADSSSSRANPNFPTYIGVKSRYGAEIKRVKKTLGQIDALDTFTFSVPNYIDDETTYLY